MAVKRIVANVAADQVDAAKAFYGDAERWKDIVAANEAKIPDPDRVAAGTIILIAD